jgi:chorismate mutase/prephenate dehydratase
VDRVPDRGSDRVPGSAATEAELRRLRRRIDALDRHIVKLLDERAALALAVDGHRAAAGGRTIRDAAREADVLRRVRAASVGPLPADDLVDLYRRLMTVTRRLQSARRLPSPRSRPSAVPKGGERRVPDR